MNEKYKSLFEARKSLRNTKFRFLPESFEMPTSTEIYKDKVIIMILLMDNPMDIMIHNKAVADCFEDYFELLWNLGQK